MDSDEVYIGSICVDSGQMMLCDPCYIENSWNDQEFDFRNIQQYAGQFNYGGACAATLSEKGAGVIGDFDTAVVCSTGYGDGKYPVYVTYEGGRIASMRIDFMSYHDESSDDDDEDEEY